MASKQVLEIFQNLIELHKTKDADYSGEGGSLSNFRACEAFGVPAWKDAANGNLRRRTHNDKKNPQATTGVFELAGVCSSDYGNA
jgi:hypothetical protein